MQCVPQEWGVSSGKQWRTHCAYNHYIDMLKPEICQLATVLPLGTEGLTCMYSHTQIHHHVAHLYVKYMYIQHKESIGSYALCQLYVRTCIHTALGFDL